MKRCHFTNLDKMWSESEYLLIYVEFYEKAQNP